jgi:hypothetical protein
MLGFIHCIISFSTADSLCVLHTTLLQPKLEYASVAWNSFTSTDSAKLKGIQRKFAAFVIANSLWAYTAVIMKLY